MTKSTDIHDLIQTCDLLPGEDTTRRLLDICAALNKRMDEIESRHQRTANISSCLASGVQPD